MRKLQELCRILTERCVNIKCKTQRNGTLRHRRRLNCCRCRRSMRTAAWTMIWWMETWALGWRPGSLPVPSGGKHRAFWVSQTVWRAELSDSGTTARRQRHCGFLDRRPQRHSAEPSGGFHNQAILDKATSHTKNLLQKTEERAKVLEKEVNSLQWELSFNQMQMKKSVQTLEQKYQRVLCENKILIETLEKREIEIQQLRTQNSALNQQCSELISILDVKEQRIYLETKPKYSQSRDASVLELAVLGACRCPGVAEACPCSRTAAATRKQLLQLQHELDAQSSRREEAVMVADAFRIAFEQQLRKRSEHFLLLAEANILKSHREKSEGVNRSPLVSVSDRLKGLLPSGLEVKMPDDLLEALYRLLDLLNDKEVALAHQKKVSLMLAHSADELQRKLHVDSHFLSTDPFLDNTLPDQNQQSSNLSENLEPSDLLENRQPSNLSENQKQRLSNLQKNQHGSNLSVNQHLAHLPENQQPSDQSENVRPSDLSDTPQPTSLTENHQRSNLSENQQPSDHPQNHQSSNLSENQHLAHLPENQQPSDQSDNQQPSNLSENQKPSNQPETQQPSNLSENQQPSDHPDNHQSSNLSENQYLAHLPENQQPSNLSENQQPSDNPENQQPSDNPENQQPSNLSEYQQASDQPENHQPPTPPEKQQPSNKPEHQQPSNLVDNQKPSNLPENQQPSNLPDNQKPSNLPENQQLSNQPENKQPSDLPENQHPSNIPENQQP
ncbi:coiled-coil domain-containing protein 125 isoform X2 [Takifugu flavidus]|uniref:coiled-coil domain-containing protein 125 isoform X2 n=1 Tax=Takifugu flavidus TaxID=433684 RepID=UPI002544AF46|nr:coiled-coil domain-containing protein 125 isoform X2 [Takifugu flavidus]